VLARIKGDGTFSGPVESPNVVIPPSSNSANYIPQWNGADSKTLKDGLAVGTAANNLIQLDAEAKLPAVDGSQLTNVVANIPSYLNTWYVGSHGSDDNTGTNPDKAFLTLGKALTEADAGDKIEVIGPMTITGPLTITEEKYVYAPGATFAGPIQLNSGASLTCLYHIPTDNDQTLLTKVGSRYSYYRCVGSDARGFTGVTNIRQTDAGSILFVDVEYMFTSSTGILDESEGGAGSLVNIALTPSGFSSSTLQSGAAGNVADNEPAGNFAQWQISPTVTPGNSIESQGHYLGYDAGEDKIITQYDLRTNFTTRAPRGWKLYGSATGVFGGEEVLLDTQTDITSWSTSVYKTFAITNEDPYRYYRFVWTQGNANNFLRVSGMKLNIVSAEVGGHMHFNIKDLYLVGSSPIGIDAESNGSSLIGYIDHIVPFPEATGATAVYVAAAGRVELTCNEIRFTGHTAYNVQAGGTLTLNCLRILGTRTGTAVIPEAIDKTPASVTENSNLTIALLSKQLIETNSSSTITLSIKPQTDIAYSDHSSTNILNINSGNVEITADAGVVLNGVDGETVTVAAGQIAFLKRIGEDEWLIPTSV
jgi:hypothetical protein